MLTRDELIHKVVARIQRMLPEDQAPLVEEFVRQYYGWLIPEEFLARSPVDVYGAALAHLNFARQRPPDEAKVRVYTPRFEEHGWQSTHTVVEVVAEDRPFLVDSVGMEIDRQGYSVHTIVHPVMTVRRDADGRLIEVLPHSMDSGEADKAAKGTVRESVMHVEVDRHTGPEELEKLRENICRVLGEVRVAVEDWQEMREKACRAASGLEAGEGLPVGKEASSEAGAFLRWVSDDHFTFLGYREYELTSEGGEDALRPDPEPGLAFCARRTPCPSPKASPGCRPRSGSSPATRNRSCSQRRTPGLRSTAPRTSTTSA